jgi:hypothetical protein
MLPGRPEHAYGSEDMIRILTVTLAALGAVSAFAQDPTLWRDPGQGCSYLVTPQGGVTLRYRRDGTPDCQDTGPSASAQAAPAAEPRIPFSPPGAADARSRTPILAAPAAMAFSCRGSGAEGRESRPDLVRVRIEPDARSIVVDRGGASQRYTLDSAGDVWFNGRSERDPRLGIILSPSSGSMWLDSAVGEASQRFVSHAQAYLCRPEGAMY